MSKKNKNKIRQTPWSLGSLPITPVETKNPNAPQSREELLAELQREEEQKRLAADPVHQAITAQSKAVTGLRKLTIEFWSRPIADILADGECEAARDVTFSVPATTSQYTFEDARRAFDKGYAAIEHEGYQLTESGGQKLVRFGLAQAKFGADMSNANAWLIAFRHLNDELRVFSDADFAKRPRLQPGPAPKPTLETIESLNISGNEADARRAKQIAQELMWAEGSPIHHQWMASLLREFNFVPTDADLRYIYNTLFPKNNWSYTDQTGESFNKARRAMVAQGRWPESLLTADERTAKWIEEGESLSTLDFNERTRLKKRLALLKDQAS